jgi:hypothetical protein
MKGENAMATTMVVETFPKATVTREQVEAERGLRLTAPATVSSEISDSDDPERWVLKTIIQLEAPE